jgi:hypothetical protein
MTEPHHHPQHQPPKKKDNGIDYQGMLFKAGGTIVAGFILAVLLRECRDIRQTRDSVMRLEDHEKQQKQKK